MRFRLPSLSLAFSTMINALLVIYILVYLAVATGGIWADFRSKYAWWLTIVDLLSSVLSIVGMILFIVDFHSQQLLSASKYAFPLIVLSYFFVTIIDVYDEFNEDPANKIDTGIGFGLALLFELPCLMVLFQYTYRSY